MPTSGNHHLLGLTDNMKSKYVLLKMIQQIARYIPGSGGRKATGQASQLILTGTEKRLQRLGQQWAMGELMSR